ncbi:energy-coupling factor ABC transporter ATP-binding protein [Chachezhania sediminis]|uniref:energy-coupling factor ABC transporter ATP-binding protein n=1 Tax=Chachezhania sediminis TaxID=2599291 RepID=UPI00131DC6D1|nr:energy-coupling factor ABC transporter ATP-binding protein [Chachezhania sediminis]
MSRSETPDRFLEAEITPARIRFEDVSLKLEDRVVFDGLSLDVDVSRTGLVGRNGAGKSQFLRLVAGLVKPDSGNVTVNGFDPAADRKRATTEIGFVFQNPEHGLLFPTVLEELTFGLKAHGMGKREAEAQAHRILARFGVPGWPDRLVHSLSQGQKHLLCLMVALAPGPGLLLLDEAFAGLDLPTETSLHRMLSRLSVAQIAASHDLAALARNDSLIWIDAGTVRTTGTPEQILPAYRDAMEGRILPPDAL